MTSTLDSSFTTRDVPWRKLGAIIDDESIDATRAAQLGGLDFDVEMRRASFERADGASWRVVTDRRSLVRADTEQFFSFVSTRYQVVQYRDAFTFMDAINPHYVAAGAFAGGKQGFMVVQLPGHASLDPTPNGESDPHQLYVVLRTSHDLSKAIEVAVLPLRDRCMNQLTLPSFAVDAPQRWSIRHVGDPTKKLRNAQDTLKRASRYAEQFERTVQRLADISVDTDNLRRVLRRVLPDRPKRPEQLAAIEAAFRSSERVGFTGTGWGATNAVSEYFEHGRDGGSRTEQARFIGGLNGATAKYVRRTAQLLLLGN